MAMSGYTTEDERKRNGYCRYFAKGECREGNDCKFSHNSQDIPICRYYLEDRCHFGSDCWFRHPGIENDMFDMSPMAAIIGSGLMCSINPNMNLLLAAAIAGAPTPGQEEKDHNSDDEKEKEDVSLEKVLEIWKNVKTKDEDNNDSNKPSAVNEELCDCEREEEYLQDFSHELKSYSIKSWSAENIFTLIKTLTTLDVVEFDEYDFITSRIIGDVLRFWKPDSHAAAALLMMIVEKCEADLTSLILTVCNSPDRVYHLERHIACTMLAAQKKDNVLWNSKAIGTLMQKIEENGFNVDAIEFFHSIGKEIQDAEKLGELVHDYLVATGEREDSFACRCKTAECQCPVEADEGVAFIMFSGLQKKLDWNDDDKVKFFKKATDSLWKPELLAELGETFGVKEALKISTPRKLNRRQKIMEVSEQEARIISKEIDEKNQNKPRKCQGYACFNQNKRGCDNIMCKRCCKNSGIACEAHEDPFDVYIPPVYETSHKFNKVEPSLNFTSKERFAELTSKKKSVRRVSFGEQYSVKDDEIIKIVDLWGAQLVVLELGSADSGCGSQITDKSVLHITAKCPNLRKIRLESATGVTDKAMCSIFSKCPLLEELHVSGNDKSSGHLSDKSMKLLFEDTVLPNLKQVCVYDQSGIERDVVYRLRRRRPNMKIIAGETDSDSFAHGMVLSMMGLDYGDGLY